jgi:hypothetical protein
MMLTTYLTDPGYLPFFYPATTRRSFTFDELRYGTAVTPQQRSWARRQSRAGRIQFGRHSGRFIIRGDHYCSFMGNWIGLGNHRYFILAVLYIVFYITFYVVHLVYLWWGTNLHLKRWELIGLLGAGVVFYPILLSNLVRQIIDVAHNVVLVDVLRRRPSNWDRGCMNNFEEVCGPRRFLPLWCVPVPLPRSIDGFGYGEMKPESEESDQSDPILVLRTPGPLQEVPLA